MYARLRKIHGRKKVTAINRINLTPISGLVSTDTSIRYISSGVSLL